MGQVSAPIWAHIGVRLRERSLAETGAGQGHDASGEEAKPSERARRVDSAWCFPNVGALNRGTLERRSTNGADHNNEASGRENWVMISAGGRVAAGVLGPCLRQLSPLSLLSLLVPP